jgi:hypothetical protein
MTRDQNHPTVPAADDDDRTEQAKNVVADYAKALREMIRKLRRQLN